MDQWADPGSNCCGRLSGVLVIVPCPHSLWDFLLLKPRAHANLGGRNQSRCLSLAQTFQLQGKGAGRYLTFKTTAGTSEISTDTFIKCHHFGFSSTARCLHYSTLITQPLGFSPAPPPWSFPPSPGLRAAQWPIPFVLGYPVMHGDRACKGRGRCAGRYAVTRSQNADWKLSLGGVI